MENLQISPQAEQSLQRLQDTELTPLEEALFQAWTKANQIENPDDPKDITDYRGIWRGVNGLVLPRGEVKKMAEDQNNTHNLQRELQQRMLDRITEMTGKKEDFAKDRFDAERQDITHKQKMEQGGQKLKMAPFELKKAQHATESKKVDIEKQKLGLEASKLGNEGKEIDLIASLMQPAGGVPAQTASKPKSSSDK